MPLLEHCLCNIEQTIFRVVSLHLKQVSQSKYDSKFFGLVLDLFIRLGTFKHNVTLVDFVINLEEFVRVISFEDAAGF